MDISGIDHWWINDTSSFSITEDGILTNTVSLSPGIYFLEIRAYDPSGNFCLSVIKVIVNRKTSIQQFPLMLTIITLLSVIGGAGVVTVVIALLHRRKR